MVATIAPTVGSSLRAGMHTDTVVVPFASTSALDRELGGVVGVDVGRGHGPHRRRGPRTEARPGSDSSGRRGAGTGSGARNYAAALRPGESLPGVSAGGDDRGRRAERARRRDRTHTTSSRSSAWSRSPPATSSSSAGSTTTSGSRPRWRRSSATRPRSSSPTRAASSSTPTTGAAVEGAKPFIAAGKEVGGHLREDLAVGGQIGHQPAVVDAHLHVHVEEAAAQGVAHRRGQLRRPSPVRALIGTAFG